MNQQTTLPEALNLLRNWRENNERRSEDVIRLWRVVVEYNINKLGNEKHVILEQVCIAALDTYQIAIVDFCIKQLSNEFPSSLRVKKYYAMRLEAQERYDDALRILDAIIKKDGSNSAPRKRKIAILKAQGRYVEAVKELTEYLKDFMADSEAWQELSELYLAEQDFAKAAFCFEELLLHNPHNHLLYQRYAEIKYTQGGYENVEVARAYYCQALQLNPNNLRALFGVYLSASNIAASPKCVTQRKKEASKMAEWALAGINRLYLKANDGNPDSNLAECLSALSIV